MRRGSSKSAALLLCIASFYCAMASLGGSPALAQTGNYDPRPWLDDLAQMRAAFSTKYADFEWAVFVHEVDVSRLFADAKNSIEQGGGDADARAAFDRLIRRLGDGHVELQWPQRHALSEAKASSDPCREFNPEMAARPLAAFATGYAPIDSPHPDVFPVGVIVSGKHRVGVIKIKLFSPRFEPRLCASALAALSIPQGEPCDGPCQDRIDEWTEARMNEDFIAQIETLERANIDTLLVDIADNGGGSEWADAASRMLTPIRLRSRQGGFMRGEHWVKKLTNLEASLRSAADKAPLEDRKLLLQAADQTAEKRAVAATPCDAAPLWEGRHPACAWLGVGFYASGPLASADPDRLRGKPWAALLFHPMKYQYQEGLWRGPLIVLADSRSASASDWFASQLQDNRAALIMGEPTEGGVGGHTDGGTPTTLTHSGAILVLPDISELPPNGELAFGGVVPDVLVGVVKSNGPHRRAAAFLTKLPEALARLEGQIH